MSFSSALSQWMNEEWVRVIDSVVWVRKSICPYRDLAPVTCHDNQAIVHLESEPSSCCCVCICQLLEIVNRCIIRRTQSLLTQYLPIKCESCIDSFYISFFLYNQKWLNILKLVGVCWCERLADGWGTTATTCVSRLQIGERPREWTRG